MGDGTVIDFEPDDELDAVFEPWDGEWMGLCASCDAPIDLHNCSELFYGATPQGDPIALMVCSLCAYQDRLERDMD